MARDRIEIGLQPGTRIRRVGLIALGALMVPALISFWLDPPRSGWFGTSGFLPRALAAVGLPAVLLLIAAGIWSLFDRRPELTMDASGVVAKTLFRTRQVRWDEIAKLTNDKSESAVLFVHLKTGDRFKIGSAAFESGWDRDRIVAEMGRLSGGRARVSGWHRHRPS